MKASTFCLQGPILTTEPSVLRPTILRHWRLGIQNVHRIRIVHKAALKEHHFSNSRDRKTDVIDKKEEWTAGVAATPTIALHLAVNQESGDGRAFRKVFAASFSICPTNRYFPIQGFEENRHYILRLHSRTLIQ
jgi:hypothetical protein